jgi:hypothetical protein
MMYVHGVDPRTFLPPRALPVARTPQPGDEAPALPLAIGEGRPSVVAFLRHTGCPFAEQTMHLLVDAATRTPEVRWIAISHARADATERWCRAIGGADGVLVASDPSRRSYAAWGLPRTSIAHFLGRRSLAAVADLARRGVRNRHPHGTRWQSAGAFALDAQATVRWSSLPAHAGDLPDLDAALASLR